MYYVVFEYMRLFKIILICVNETNCQTVETNY